MMIIAGNVLIPSFLSYETFQGNNDLGTTRISLIRSLSLSQKCPSFNLAHYVPHVIIAFDVVLLI